MKKGRKERMYMPVHDSMFMQEKKKKKKEKKKRKKKRTVITYQK